MRIILEPTELDTSQHTVIIEDPSDAITIWDLAELLRGALIAYGYHSDNVDSILESEAKEIE